MLCGAQFLIFTTVHADSLTQVSAPMIAIIIDDLGNQKIAGERAVQLPGPVVCAVMPHTAYSTYLANQAHAAGKEVMLHLPMQGMEMSRKAGPGGIGLDTSRQHLGVILESDLQDVPHVTGINNHMGSLITRHPGHMEWLMDELLERGNLFFIDSYTTASSVAYATAIRKGVPSARRNVFLDNLKTEENIAAQFSRLKREALKTGYAIGIGHPYDITLTFLEQALPEMEKEGFQLVPVSSIVDYQTTLHESLQVAQPDLIKKVSMHDGGSS